MGKKEKTVFVALALGLLPCFWLWLVNLEIAMQPFFSQWNPLERIVSGKIYGWMRWLSADLSTISTLIPILLLLFPAMRLFESDRNERPLDIRWYPEHFAYFLVMLGLAGTLYGLLIGIKSSGIRNGVDIDASIHSLLEGTATALLSSLMGIVGAFLASKPIPDVLSLIFPEPVKDLGDAPPLTETIQQLAHDLAGLSKASQEFTRQLNHESLHVCFDRMDRMDTQLRLLGERLIELREDQARTHELLSPLEELRGSSAKTVDALREMIDETRLVRSDAEEGRKGLRRALAIFTTEPNEP